MAMMLEALDEDTLIKIMTEPKNAIVKQYRKFFDLDKVELVFTPEAIRATAREALKHKTGARGLRTIVEEVLLDVMYEIPSRQDIKRCKITEKVIWHVVRKYALCKHLGKIAPHDLRLGRTCARLCHEAAGELEQIQFLLGHISVQTTEQYLGCTQRFRSAVNHHIGIEPDEEDRETAVSTDARSG